MKAKATDEDGGVETVVGVRPALKSFLHQVISDQQECNKGGLGPGLGPLGLNGKRTVSALSRLIELPNLDAKKEPPSPPAKPKNNVNNNNKNVRGHERLERKAAVLLPDKPAVQAVEPAPSSKPASATAVATAAAATPNGAGQRTKTVTDDWWRERASRPGATAVATSLRREALSRKSSDADGRRGASPARKPSFKVAAHRTKSRTHTPAVTAAVKVTIPSTRSSRVQALATKFNSMEETTPPTSPTSPCPAPDIKIIVGNRAGVLKSVSPAIMDEVKALSDKIHHLQDLQDKQSKVALVRKRPSFAKSRVAANGNKVKAAVKIFEHGPGETATQTTKSRPTTQDGATQTPPAVDPPATNGLTRGAGAAEETAISDVPKKEETSRRKPQRPVSPVSPGARRVREETLADKALADKARRSYNHKVMLKTSKSVLSENSSKRLVVVNFDDDDIDAIPPLPSTPPPDQRPATTSSSTPVRDILARAVSPVPLPVAPEVTAPKLPPPGEIADEKEPPVAPALPERNPLAEEDDEEAMNAKIQANRSFLWRPAPPVPQQSKRKDTDDGPSFRAVPALIEPDVEVPLAGCDDNPEVDDDPQELYDDVVSPTDENIYDDIGVDVKKPDEQPQQEMYETCGGGNYDDCEGEGYQFVDSAGQQGPALAAGPAQASPQRVATTLEEEDETEDNIYDDVLSERRPPSPPAPVEADDAVSTSGVYEAIYLVRPKGQRGPPPSRRLPLLPPGVPGRGLGVGRHGSSCSSSSSSRSSSAGNASSYCGKINSIYGESLTDEQAMAVAAVLELPFEPGAVQAARVPLSETSDEWVDLDNTPTDQEDQDDEETIVVFRDQPRRRRATSWSRKVRTQRTRSPRRRGDVSTDSDNENPYESLYENPDAIDDIDSFDSDSDEEGHHTSHPHHEPGISNLQNGKLPDVPPRENIYGVHVMRFKEAAGKKMQKIAKNWSLRKNDISNKLSRMRRKSSVDPRGAAALSVPESSPPRTPPMGKSQSSNQLAGNKYWSFKSKFKRSQSTSTSLGSTFYLTEELVVGNESSSSVSQVDSNSTYTDSASPASQRSGPPSNILPLPLPPRPPSATSQQNYINERRNSGAVRPNSPPPPPPPVPKRNGPQKDRDKTKSSSSSWYAECGLFDSSSLDSIKRAQKEDPLNTSLYAEAGLWDNVPPPSSSPYDSSQSEHDASQTTDYSDSSAGHTGPLFSDEPLYQFYNASVFEQARREEAAEGDSDGYEEIVDGIVKTTRPSAMELIRPREGKHRTLWCEIPEVKESGVLDSLSAHEKKLQESKFELITSEASYIKSLIVLEKHFMNSVEFRDESILSKGDRRILFSNVNPVRTRSEKFLADMEHCWQDSIMLQGICDIVKRHASEYFNVYTKYCTNQIYLDRTLKKLREGDGRFSEALLHLESSPECQSLSLHSFLMLPMQRITRLRLLLDAVLKRLTPEHDEYNSCQQACASLNKVVNECNEGARKMERYEEMMLLSRQLEFSQTVKPVPIISAARWLVKSGALTQMIWRNDDAKLTFGRKVNKITVHLFLFTDILVITKRKSEDVYSVVDYCPRNLVQMSSMEDLPQPQQLQLQPPLKGGAGGRHLVLLTMLQNQETKTVEMVLSCGSESDRERWLAAVSPPKSDNPNEQLYEIWDCPQVRSEHPYAAQQPDELSLDVGDVVNVLRKTKDGWYEGERIRDREKGWFPANYTVEIASAHIRAKNLKQRHRFLILSGSYLQESRSKNK